MPNPHSRPKLMHVLSGASAGRSLGVLGIVTIALLGCTLTPEMAVQRGSNDLCYIVANGGPNSRVAASQELSRRGYTCPTVYPSASSANPALDLYNAYNAQKALNTPPPPRPPIICHTMNGTTICQ